VATGLELGRVDGIVVEVLFPSRDGAFEGPAESSDETEGPPDGASPSLVCGARDGTLEGLDEGLCDGIDDPSVGGLVEDSSAGLELGFDEGLADGTLP
jgi:hypothetical protein